MDKVIRIGLYILGFLLLLSLYLVILKKHKIISELKTESLASQHYLKESLFQAYELGSLKLDEKLFVPNDSVLKINSRPNNNELFFYIPESLCGRCNQDIIIEFSKHINRIGSNNIIVLVSEDDLDDFKALKDEFSLNLNKIYVLKNSSLSGFTNFDQSVPLLFQINDNNYISNAFSPNNKNISLFSDYLSWIINGFKQSK